MSRCGTAESEDASVRPDEPLIIGWVSRPHGVRGEIKVRPDTDFPERFLRLTQVLIVPREGGPPTGIAVEGVRPHGTEMLMKLQGVDDLEAARGLAGAGLAVPWDERIPLPEGAFYVREVVGMTVRTLQGEALGHVTEVLRSAGNDVYRVAGQAGELLLPATRDVIRTVDVARREMTVDLPEGLR